MPQPTFATTGSPTRIICQLGGLALPNGQGTMATYDLNDSVSWFLQDLPEVTMSRSIGLSQLAWRARGVYVSDDFAAKKIVLHQLYYESSTATPLAYAKAQLSQAGEQYLTFDNATRILVKLSDWGTPASRRKFQPYLWDLDLTFTCREPWFKDISATTSSTALNATTTSFSIAYSGSVFAEPVWTWTIPSANTATISSFALGNTLSGETITATFPTPLAASRATTVTIDCSGFTVKKDDGTSYDVSGSFPMIYPPAGQSNTFATTVTPATGTASTSTLAWSFNNRWDF